MPFHWQTEVVGCQPMLAPASPPAHHPLLPNTHPSLTPASCSRMCRALSCISCLHSLRVLPHPYTHTISFHLLWTKADDEDELAHPSGLLFHILSKQIRSSLFLVTGLSSVPHTPPIGLYSRFLLVKFLPPAFSRVPDPQPPFQSVVREDILWVLKINFIFKKEYKYLWGQYFIFKTHISWVANF